MIKTIELTAAEEVAVELAGGVHARIENRGTGIVYASKTDNVTAGEDGVVAVSSGGTKYLKNACSYANYEGNFGYKGTIYLKSSEDGIVEIETGDYFFDSVNKSEGGGSSPVDAYTKAEIDTFLADKVNVKNGYSLVADSEITRLAGVTNYDDSALQSKVAENAFTLGYSGKNLLKTSESLTVDQYVKLPISLKAGISYTITAKITSTTVSSSNKPAIRFMSSTNNIILDKTLYDISGGLNKINFVLPEDCVKIEVYAGSGYGSSAGHTTTYYQFMLRPASIIDDTYEPYKPSVDERLKALEAALLNS